MTVMAKILAFWKNFSVHKKGKGVQVSKDIIERSGLFGNFNETETDDNFSGTYDGVDVCISEQEVIYRGRKMSHTHFKGVFILLKWDKKLAKKTIARSRDLVIPGGLMGSYCFIAVGLMPLVIAAPFLINWISGNGRIDIMLLFMCFLPAAIYLTVLYFVLFYKWKKNESGGGSLFPVILEDPLFRKKWSVISNDQIEARVILTPRFMERLKAVKNYFHGNRIDCSFFGNSVLIAVYTTKDMFETTSVFTSSLNYHKMYEVVTQMYSVFSVISEINGKKFNN